MKLFSAFALTALLLSGVAHAEDAVSPKRLALAKEVMSLNGSGAVYDHFDQTLDAMIAQVRRNLPGADDQVIADIKKIAIEEFTAVKPELIEKTAEVYARHFSEGDLRALIVFYKTPAGKRFAAELPALSNEIVKLNEPFNTRFTARLKVYILDYMAKQQAEQDAEHKGDEKPAPDQGSEKAKPQ